MSKDVAQAEIWFNKAKEHGDDQVTALAFYGLGFLYSQCHGDSEKAAAYLRQSAERGHGEAQIMLGFLYFQGDGVAKDEERAVGWWRKAAEEGHAEAMTRRLSSFGVPVQQQQLALSPRNSPAVSPRTIGAPSFSFPTTFPQAQTQTQIHVPASLATQGGE